MFVLAVCGDGVAAMLVPGAVMAVRDGRTMLVEVLDGNPTLVLDLDGKTIFVVVFAVG